MKTFIRNYRHMRAAGFGPASAFKLAYGWTRAIQSLRSITK